MEMCDPFGWHKVDAALIRELLQKLKSFESMTWGDILGRRHHLISTDDLCTDAKKRLAALNLDDLEQLVSLAIGGTERIWGVLEHNILTLLWWDPDHQVCPSPKKHT